jgi:TolB-like protein/tetratricopeptide (TPR) repeat protein
MDAERWIVVRELFDQLVELDGAERARRLELIGGSDRALRDELASLLARDSEPSGPIGRFMFPMPDPGPPGDPFGLSGHVVSHFRVLAPLGAGGMGVVYRAEDTRLGRMVALKFLLPQYHLDPTAKQRFLQEARSAAALDDPNVCSVHEVGESEDGHLFLAMPLYAGETLETRLGRESPLLLEEAVEIARQVTRGLACAHAAGIIHRDLKPGNLMLVPGPTVKILDFGLAKVRDLNLTGSQARFGTVSFMAPEQVSGKEITPSTDLWALGVVLYQMLTGQRPFGGDELSTLNAILHVEPVRPSSLRAEIPSWLDDVVMRLLRKDPAERYAGAGELLGELDGNEPAKRPRFLPPVRRWWTARPSRPLLAGAGAVAAAVVLSLGGWWVTKDATGPSPPAIQRIAVLPLANLTHDPEQEYFVEGMHEGLISELAQAGIPVIARTSVVQYASSRKAVREIARELKVDAVVEGSVLREGEHVRIQLQLIDARSQALLWARSYDTPLRDVLALHRRVTREVAQEIKATLSPGAQARLAAARPVDPDAYEAYLRGRFHAYKGTFGHQLARENLDAAMQYFRAALQKDPGYAPAYAGIGAVWWSRGLLRQADLKEAHAEARSATLKAIELDDGMAEGHEVLGRILTSYEWDWSRAEEEYRRAIELNPNSAAARAHYSLLLMTQGRTQEAETQIARATELAPLEPYYQTFYAYELGQMRRYDDAIAQARRTLAMVDADSLFLREVRWRALHQKGAYPEALAEARALFADDAEVVDALSSGYSAGGYTEANRRAAETLARRSTSGFWEPEHLAILYAFAGQKQRALDWLDRGYDTHHSMMGFIGIDPHWDALRSEPRFQELLRKLNLPQQSGTGPPSR